MNTDIQQKKNSCYMYLNTVEEKIQESEQAIYRGPAEGWHRS